MCDALSRNRPSVLKEYHLSLCNAHGRRAFVEIATHFPEPVTEVLTQYKVIWVHDDYCHQQSLSPSQRLAYHREHSLPVMERIRDWGKKVVVVVNKIDILETDEDIAHIETFIADNARLLLGFIPEIFPVSARQALRAKMGSNGNDLLTSSRFEELERFIVASLDEEERIRLKLLNPLGVGAHLVGKYLSVIDGRLGLLKDDLATIKDTRK